jgi:hypothetical protein
VDDFIVNSRKEIEEEDGDYQDSPLFLREGQRKEDLKT